MLTLHLTDKGKWRKVKNDHEVQGAVHGRVKDIELHGDTTTRGLSSKRLRLRAGWRPEWYTPSPTDVHIREVVPGPFRTPRLVSKSPFVIVKPDSKGKLFSACAELLELKSGRRCVNLRTGVPDPWAEYLVFQAVGLSCSRIQDEDRALWASNIQITEAVWREFGHVGQGIPDPWKHWPKSTSASSSRGRSGAGRVCKQDCQCTWATNSFECQKTCDCSWARRCKCSRSTTNKASTSTKELAYDDRYLNTEDEECSRMCLCNKSKQYEISCSPRQPTKTREEKPCPCPKRKSEKNEEKPNYPEKLHQKVKMQPPSMELEDRVQCSCSCKKVGPSCKKGMSCRCSQHTKEPKRKEKSFSCPCSKNVQHEDIICSSHSSRKEPIMQEELVTVCSQKEIAVLQQSPCSCCKEETIKKQKLRSYCSNMERLKHKELPSHCIQKGREKKNKLCACTCVQNELMSCSCLPHKEISRAQKSTSPCSRSLKQLKTEKILSVSNGTRETDGQVITCPYLQQDKRKLAKSVCPSSCPNTEIRMQEESHHVTQSLKLVLSNKCTEETLKCPSLCIKQGSRMEEEIGCLCSCIQKRKSMCCQCTNALDIPKPKTEARDCIFKGDSKIDKGTQECLCLCQKKEDKVKRNKKTRVPCTENQSQQMERKQSSLCISKCKIKDDTKPVCLHSSCFKLDQVIEEEDQYLSQDPEQDNETEKVVCSCMSTAVKKVRKEKPCFDLCQRHNNKSAKKKCHCCSCFVTTQGQKQYSAGEETRVPKRKHRKNCFCFRVKNESFSDNEVYLQSEEQPNHNSCLCFTSLASNMQQPYVDSDLCERKKNQVVLNAQKASQKKVRYKSSLSAKFCHSKEALLKEHVQVCNETNTKCPCFSPLSRWMNYMATSNKRAIMERRVQMDRFRGIDVNTTEYLNCWKGNFGQIMQPNTCACNMNEIPPEDYHNPNLFSSVSKLDSDRYKEENFRNYSKSISCKDSVNDGCQCHKIKLVKQFDSSKDCPKNKNVQDKTTSICNYSHHCKYPHGQRTLNAPLCNCILDCQNCHKQEKIGINYCNCIGNCTCQHVRTLPQKSTCICTADCNCQHKRTSSSNYGCTCTHDRKLPQKTFNSICTCTNDCKCSHKYNSSFKPISICKNDHTCSHKDEKHCNKAASKPADTRKDFHSSPSNHNNKILKKCLCSSAKHSTCNSCSKEVITSMNTPINVIRALPKVHTDNMHSRNCVVDCKYKYKQKYHTHNKHRSNENDSPKPDNFNETKGEESFPVSTCSEKIEKFPAIKEPENVLKCVQVSPDTTKVELKTSVKLERHKENVKQVVKAHKNDSRKHPRHVYLVVPSKHGNMEANHAKVNVKQGNDSTEHKKKRKNNANKSRHSHCDYDSGEVADVSSVSYLDKLQYPVTSITFIKRLHEPQVRSRTDDTKFEPITDDNHGNLNNSLSSSNNSDSESEEITSASPLILFSFPEKSVRNRIDKIRQQRKCRKRPSSNCLENKNQTENSTTHKNETKGNKSSISSMVPVTKECNRDTERTTLNTPSNYSSIKQQEIIKEDVQSENKLSLNVNENLTVNNIIPDPLILSQEAQNEVKKTMVAKNKTFNTNKALRAPKLRRRVVLTKDKLTKVVKTTGNSASTAKKLKKASKTKMKVRIKKESTDSSKSNRKSIPNSSKLGRQKPVPKRKSARTRFNKEQNSTDMKECGCKNKSNVSLSSKLPKKSLEGIPRSSKVMDHNKTSTVPIESNIPTLSSNKCEEHSAIIFYENETDKKLKPTCDTSTNRTAHNKKSPTTTSYGSVATSVTTTKIPADTRSHKTRDVDIEKNKNICNKEENYVVEESESSEYWSDDSEGMCFYADTDALVIAGPDSDTNMCSVTVISKKCSPKKLSMYGSTNVEPVINNIEFDSDGSVSSDVSFQVGDHEESEVLLKVVSHQKSDEDFVEECKYDTKITTEPEVQRNKSNNPQVFNEMSGKITKSSENLGRTHSKQTKQSDQIKRNEFQNTETFPQDSTYSQESGKQKIKLKHFYADPLKLIVKESRQSLAEEHKSNENQPGRLFYVDPMEIIASTEETVDPRSTQPPVSHRAIPRKHMVHEPNTPSTRNVGIYGGRCTENKKAQSTAQYTGSLQECKYRKSTDICKPIKDSKLGGGTKIVRNSDQLEETSVEDLIEEIERLTLQPASTRKESKGVHARAMGTSDFEEDSYAGELGKTQVIESKTTNSHTVVSEQNIESSSFNQLQTGSTYGQNELRKEGNDFPVFPLDDLQPKVQPDLSLGNTPSNFITSSPIHTIFPEKIAKDMTVSQNEKVNESNRDSIGSLKNIRPLTMSPTSHRVSFTSDTSNRSREEDLPMKLKRLRRFSSFSTEDEKPQVPKGKRRAKRPRPASDLLSSNHSFEENTGSEYSAAKDEDILSISSFNEQDA